MCVDHTAGQPVGELPVRPRSHRRGAGPVTDQTQRGNGLGLMAHLFTGGEGHGFDEVTPLGELISTFVDVNPSVAESPGNTITSPARSMRSPEVTWNGDSPDVARAGGLRYTEVRRIGLVRPRSPRRRRPIPPAAALEAGTPPAALDGAPPVFVVAVPASTVDASATVPLLLDPPSPASVPDEPGRVAVPLASTRATADISTSTDGISRWRPFTVAARLTQRCLRVPPCSGRRGRRGVARGLRSTGIPHAAG